MKNQVQTQAQPVSVPNNGSTDKLTTSLVDAFNNANSSQTEEVVGRVRGALDEQTVHLQNLITTAATKLNQSQKMTTKKKLAIGGGVLGIFSLGFLTRGLFGGKSDDTVEDTPAVE